MDAGELNKRVILQVSTKARTTGGDVTETWTDYATVWAKIRPLRGREYYNAQQIQTENYVEITIRFRHNVTPEWRINYGRRYFNIETVINPDESNQYLELICTEETT